MYKEFRRGAFFTFDISMHKCTGKKLNSFDVFDAILFIQTKCLLDNSLFKKHPNTVYLFSSCL